MNQRGSNAQSAKSGGEPDVDTGSIHSSVPGLRAVNQAHAAESAVSVRGGENQPSDEFEKMVGRIKRLERQNRRIKFAMIGLLIMLGIVGYIQLMPHGTVVQKQLLESQELKLLDGDGNARLFLRMYSRVPVLQLMDGNGKPRMSLGLRFDDTPFIDLSDKTGRTRATFEMTEEDNPTLRLFDDEGNPSFTVN